ncbi:MAG: glycosyltransferase [Planctomycetes bacterium]|nr:glycosyltransferase [Planctomycetota bacterium]
MAAPPLTVIVCTYNRPQALRAVLAGLRDQSRSDFEVIVADDGSGEATRIVVESMMPSFHGRLRHAWQEDRGFRVAAARNLAASRAHTPYLAFLDGDCIPRTSFVHAYIRLMDPRRLIRGSRVLCDEALTRQIESGEVQDPHRWPLDQLRELRHAGRINRIGPLRHGFVDGLRTLASRLRPRNWKLLRGCNFMVPADAYRAVGGCDESFEGWGFEDSDLCIRLMNHGLRIRRAAADACVLHLWHRENDRRFEGENLARLQATLRSGQTRPARGMQAQEGSP